MENQTVESYLKSMKLKTKSFGGYDPEDVIVKMTELVKLARAEGSGNDSTLEEYRAKAEAALKEQEQLRQQVEALQTEQAEKLQTAEAALAEKAAKLRDTEAELAQRTEELRQAKSAIDELKAELADKQLRCQSTEAGEKEAQQQFNRSYFTDDSDMEKLRSVLSSLEAAKEGILLQCKGQAMEEAEQIRHETALMEKRKQELTTAMRDDTQAIEAVMDTMLNQMQQLKAQLKQLRGCYGHE